MKIRCVLPLLLTVDPDLKAGRVRAPGVSTARRAPSLPELPSISQAVPGYAFDGWAGMWAPGSTPKDIITRLNLSVARIFKIAEVQERFRAGGDEAALSTPEGFARVIAQDIATWTKVVNQGGQRWP